MKTNLLALLTLSLTAFFVSSCEKTPPSVPDGTPTATGPATQTTPGGPGGVESNNTQGADQSTTPQSVPGTGNY